MTLDDLLRLAAEATPGPWRGLTHGTASQRDAAGRAYEAVMARRVADSPEVEFTDLSWVETTPDGPHIALVGNGPKGPENAKLIAAFSPEVAAALVKVAMALPQALDRMQTAWNLLHPGDLTDDEREGIAQALWFGIEEGTPLVDALDAVLAARP